MRQRLQQRAVLEARRLALGAVGHDDRAPARGGDGAQLRRGGEGRAAAAEQAGALDLVDQRAASRASRAPAAASGRLAVDGEVLLQRQRAVGGHALQQPRQRAPRRASALVGSAIVEAEPLIAWTRSTVALEC